MYVIVGHFVTASNENIVISPKLSLLPAPDVLKITISYANNNENFIKMIFSFQCSFNTFKFDGQYIPRNMHKLRAWLYLHPL